MSAPSTPRSRSTSRGARRAWACAVLLLAGSAASSCSFVVDTDSEQCATDRDCTDRGGAFAGTECRDHACVPVGGGSCATSQECLNLNDGAPAACIDGQCVLLLTPECTIVEPAESLGKEDVIYLGWMGPLVGESQSEGLPMQQGVQLALEELEQAVNGLPGGAGGGRRKLVMVACHDLDDPNAEVPEVSASERAARHLVDDVKVPLIFGPAFSGITIATATDVTIPAGVMLLSASATSPQITDLDDDDLVWRTAPSDAIQAIPLSALVAELETLVRDERGLTASDQVVVAVASKGDAYGQGLFNAMTAELEFNGKTAAENGSNFVAVTYPDPSDNPSFDYAPLITQIVGATPDIILPLGTSEGITKILEGVESGWPTTNAPPRPYYIIPDGGRLPELVAAIEANPATFLIQRVQGTVPGKKGTLYDSFSLRFRQRFGVAPGSFAENAYDSGYLAAYAILAPSGEGVSGATIAAGMMMMSDKNATEIEVGQNQINAAFNALSGGGSIDFVGASGPLDFDNATGEASADIDIWCVVLNDLNETEIVSSGRYYDAANGVIAGTNDNCQIGLGP